MSLDIGAGPARPSLADPNRASLDQATPDRALSAAPVLGSDPAFQQLFRDSFDVAYSQRDAPDRGARVLADVQHDAVHFGNEFATSALARGLYGEPVRPDVNAQLAGNLRTDAGEQTVLDAPKGGQTRTPGQGDDIVVVLDREGAFEAGHTAVLVGDDTAGWRLYSKDGTRENSGYSGSPIWTTEQGKGVGRRTGAGEAAFALHKTYDTLDDFFRDAEIADRYEEAVRVEVGNDARGAAAVAGAEAILREDYHVLRSSCAHVVEAALEGAGVEGFMVRSRATPNPFDGDRQERIGIIPRIQFGRLERLEVGDDDPSAAQTEWERRSADYDPKP